MRVLFIFNPLCFLTYLVTMSSLSGGDKVHVIAGGQITEMKVHVRDYKSVENKIFILCCGLLQTYRMLLCSSSYHHWYFRSASPTKKNLHIGVAVYCRLTRRPFGPSGLLPPQRKKNRRKKDITSSIVINRRKCEG